MSESIAGSCLCGAVRFEVRPPWLAFQYCHCSRCRKTSGSAHAANLFVAPDQLAWTAGEEHVRCYELPTARFFNHGFCEVCGSSMPWLSRTGRAWIVPAGTLDQDPGEVPQRAIYWDSRAPWFVSTAELERHAELPPRR